MGIVDMFNKEDRVEVTFSNFYNLVKGCTKFEMVENAVKANVPHKYIREMLSGVEETEPEYMKLIEDKGEENPEEVSE